MKKERARLLQTNPWREIADLQDLSAYNEQKEYVLQEDSQEIKDFNNKRKKNCDSSDYEYNLHIPPMPFSGNLLDAKLVILSLNPGYVDYLNRILIYMLDDNHRQEFLEAAKKHLRLEANSIYECNVERVVGENYWFKKLQPLADAVYENDSDNRKRIFQDVAILQYIGYSSTKYYDSKLNLKGVDFNVELLKYLSQKEDVIFLVMRAKSRWMELFSRIDKTLYYDLKEKKRLIDDVRSPLSQAITRNNLTSKGDNNETIDGFEIIVEHLKKQVQ